MRRFFVLFLLAAIFSGCGDRAAELYETARFEEQQFNAGHAAQLYREILEKYPTSPQATEARARLQALQSQAP